MKNTLRLMILVAVAAASSACMAGRQIRYARGCNTRLSMREKREACRACVDRPMPHVYLPDNPEGERCVRR